MADEIVIIATAKIGDRRSVTALFLYPIDPLLATVGGATIVPTPVSNIPPDLAQLSLITDAQLSKLNDGSLAFEIVPLYLTGGEDNTSGVAGKLKRLYRASGFVQSLRDRYRFTGRTLSVGG